MNGHEFTICGAWGVVFGVSQCSKCGTVATPENLSAPCVKEGKE